MTSTAPSSLHPFLANSPPGKPGLLKGFFLWWGSELQALFGRFTGGRPKQIHWTGESFADAAGRALKVAPAQALAVWPPDRVLSRSLILPQAAEDNLDAAVRFELGRHLPFAVEQAVYHYRPGAKDVVKGQITVDAVVLRKEDVERALHTAQRQNTRLVGLMAGGQVIKGSAYRPWSGLEKFIGLGLIAVLAAAAYLPARVYAQRLGDLQAQEIDLSRQLDAQRAIAMGRQAPALILAGLAAERRSRPSPVLFLDDLTGRFPDQSWVRFLTMENSELKLEGASASAAGIIDHLESSNWISGAEFLSPTVTDPVTGLERYRITATVTPVWPSDAEDAQ